MSAQTTADPGRTARDELLRDQWSILVEKDDRTSPEEYPDHCLITMEEVGSIIDAALEFSPSPDLVKALDTFADAVMADLKEAKRRLDADTPKDAPVHPVSAFLTGMAIHVGNARAALAAAKGAK